MAESGDNLSNIEVEDEEITRILDGRHAKNTIRQGRSGSPPPLSLIERFSKDDTMPLTTPKRGKNDMELP